MTSTKDGGSAFPYPGTDDKEITDQEGHKKLSPGREGNSGMSLRQWYAGQALIGALSHEKNMVCLGGGDKVAMKNIADDCFDMADMMIAAGEPKA